MGMDVEGKTIGGGDEDDDEKAAVAFARDLELERAGKSFSQVKGGDEEDEDEDGEERGEGDEGDEDGEEDGDEDLEDEDEGEDDDGQGGEEEQEEEDGVASVPEKQTEEEEHQELSRVRTMDGKLVLRFVLRGDQVHRWSSTMAVMLVGLLEAHDSFCCLALRAPAPSDCLRSIGAENVCLGRRTGQLPPVVGSDSNAMHLTSVLCVSPIALGNPGVSALSRGVRGEIRGSFFCFAWGATRLLEAWKVVSPFLLLKTVAQGSRCHLLLLLEDWNKMQSLPTDSFLGGSPHHVHGLCSVSGSHRRWPC